MTRIIDELRYKLQPRAKGITDERKIKKITKLCRRNKHESGRYGSY